jgi:hypothetical protein
MRKRLLAMAMAACLSISVIGCGSNSVVPVASESETEEQYSEMIWPQHGIGKEVPVPDKDPLIGKVNWEYDDSFVLSVANMTKDDFEAYSDTCYDAGFNVDYRKVDGCYQANNSEGYHLYLRLDDGNVMFVRVDGPADDSITNEFETAEMTESDTESTELKTSETNSDEIRPETKEALDSYEEFMGEYVDFMKKYNEDSSDTSLIKDYASYMTKYADFTDKFNKMEDDLNDAELSYYLKVQARVLDKLSEIQ